MQSSLSTETHLMAHLGIVAYTTFTPGCPRLVWCVCVCVSVWKEVKGTKLHKEREVREMKHSSQNAIRHGLHAAILSHALSGEGCFECMQNVFWPFLAQTGAFFYSPPYTVAFPVTQSTPLHVNTLVSICLRKHSSSSVALLAICFTAPRFPTCRTAVVTKSVSQFF